MNNYSNESRFDREINNVPDGRYQVTVKGAEIRSAALMLDFRINSGPFMNHLLRSYLPMTANAQEWLGRDLRMCGLACTESELPARLNELLGVQLEVAKKTKGRYTNIYFNHRIQSATSTNNCRR